MKESVETMASLLSRAYSVEACVARALAEMMLYCEDENLFNTICDIMVDNERHKIILKKAIEVLGYDIETLKEYAAERMELKSFNFSEDLISEILNNLLKWERWALRDYRYLLDFDLSGIDSELGNEVTEKYQEHAERLSGI